MSRNAIVILCFAVLGLVVGVMTGQWFFGLYRDSIPEALKSTVSMRGTHYVFLVHGVGSGIATFAVGVAGFLTGRMLARSPKRTA